MCVACGLLVAAAAHGQATERPAPAPRNEAPIRLAARGVQSVSMDSQSYVTGLAWSEVVDGRARVKSLVLRDGRLNTAAALLRPALVDTSTLGSNEDPVIRINPSKLVPGIAWVSVTDSANAVYFAEGSGEPEIVSATENLVELPSLAYDATGTPYIAWAEIDGGQSEVFVARRSAEAGWQTTTLTQNQRPYDLLPFVFGLDAGAEVYWYSLEGSQSLVRKATLHGKVAEPSPAEELAAIPVEWLPVLFKGTRAAAPGAYWLRPTDFGQIVERLPSGGARHDIEYPFGLKETLQFRAAVANSPQAPMVCVVPGERGWELRAENPAGGNFRIAVDEFAVPAISQSRNSVHIAWFSDPLGGGDGSLWYARRR